MFVCNENQGSFSSVISEKLKFDVEINFPWNLFLLLFDIQYKMVVRKTSDEKENKRQNANEIKEKDESNVRKGKGHFWFKDKFKYYYNRLKLVFEML